MNKILAAVVTFNRAKLVDRCLKAIENQSYKPTETLVVNNGSTDNTSLILASHTITVVNQDNLGSAGGWNTAIDYALKNNFDYIWLMDDDGYPEKSSLEILYSNIGPEFSCLSSVVISEEDKCSFVFAFPVIRSNGIPDTFKFWRKYRSLKELPVEDNNFYPYVHLFNGALISIKSIKSIGNVNKDYFMYGDEVDYYFRLKKAGKVASCIHSRHFHPNVLNREYSLQRIYYNIKNNIINYKKHHDLALLRSILSPLVILIRVSKSNGIYFALSLIVGKNSPTFFRGFINGLKEKIGRDF